MKPLNHPDVSLLSILDVCASSLRDAKLAARCLATAPQMLGHQSELEDRLMHCSLPKLSTEYGTEQISAEDAKKLYRDKLVCKSSPGRCFYDEIIMGDSELTCCPYCGYSDVSSLDHFAPKSKYPYLAIAPINLIPCCSTCNKKKESLYPKSESETLFNPYFESIDFEWLRVDLFKNHNLVAEYHVAATKLVDRIKKRRLEQHFRVFDLKNRYRSCAINEIANGKIRWYRLLEEKGAAELRNELKGYYESRKSADAGSWGTALYRALYQSEEFPQYLKRSCETDCTF